MLNDCNPMIPMPGMFFVIGYRARYFCTSFAHSSSVCSWYLLLSSTGLHSGSRVASIGMVDVCRSVLACSMRKDRACSWDNVWMMDSFPPSNFFVRYACTTDGGRCMRGGVWCMRRGRWCMRGGRWWEVGGRW